MAAPPNPKALLRAGMDHMRQALSPGERADLSERMGDHLLAALQDGLPPEAFASLPLRISGFLPIRGEIDPLPFLSRLQALGAVLMFPATRIRDRCCHLRFGVLPPAGGASLPDQMDRWAVPGPMGTREPPPDSLSDLLPHILLVPALAFDRRGHRIGWGMGCYDRTLGGMRAPFLAVGIGYDFQLADGDLPDEVHDRPVDLLATPSGILECRPGALAAFHAWLRPG